MVLEIKVPDGATLDSLWRSTPILLTYALSFINVAIFWNNHHHMFQACRRVNGNVLWANMFLLFWMSLIPFVIRWIDQSHFAPLPTASYGVVLVLSSVGYVLLERTLIACNGPDSRLAQAIGIDMKAIVSMAIYTVAIPLSWVHAWIAIALYAINALAWFAPDRRIEKVTSPRQEE